MGETTLWIVALAALALCAANCVLMTVLVLAVCGKVGAIEVRWPVWRWMWSRGGAGNGRGRKYWG
jgi:hypothetical protein